jgi:hypothetical protein
MHPAIFVTANCQRQRGVQRPHTGAGSELPTFPCTPILIKVSGVVVASGEVV